MNGHIKVPCQHCPFRRDVPPFLHPSRAQEIARSSRFEFAPFPCHKTIDYDDEDDDDEDGGGRVTHRSKTCAGWRAMAIAFGSIDEPEGWQHPANVYETAHEMTSAYDREWKDRRG